MAMCFTVPALNRAAPVVYLEYKNWSDEDFKALYVLVVIAARPIIIVATADGSTTICNFRFSVCLVELSLSFRPLEFANTVIGLCV